MLTCSLQYTAVVLAWFCVNFAYTERASHHGHCTLVSQQCVVNSCLRVGLGHCDATCRVYLALDVLRLDSYHVWVCGDWDEGCACGLIPCVNLCTSRLEVQ